MKNFYYNLLFFGFSLFVSAQEMGGTPVEGLIPIRRTDSPAQKSLNNTSEFNAMSEMQSMATTTAPTGYSTEVGTTEGQLSVSLSGGATYNIPIMVPAGINGVVPQVSLAYNSQGGNGMVGYGWNIAGVSKITRIPSTKYHDGTIDGVDFDSLDRFALDGQRLIVKTGAYGVHGTIYETENFSNVKITSYGVHPSGSTYGPAYFLVEYPDGSKGYYGNSGDSRSIMEYAITYWENPQGVRISYTYNNTNNSISIATINYGALGVATPINSIQFNYYMANVPEEFYVANQKIVQDKVLNNIVVTGSSIGFRSYWLAYDTNSLDYLRLISITEKSGDGLQSYNPTVFTYENTNDSLSYADITTSLSVGNITSLNAGTVSGDFDGDEKMEFILYPTTGTDSKAKYWLFSSIDSGNYTNFGSQHNVGAFETIFPTIWLSWNNHLMPKQGWTVVKKTNTNYTFTVYCAGIASQIYYQYDRVVSFPIQPNGSCNSGQIIPKKILSGDFNSDGLTDVIAIDNACSSKKVYFVDLKRDNTTNFLTYSGELSATLTSSSKVEVADINGDGKSDFMVFENGKVTCYTLNDSNQLVLLCSYTDTNISVATTQTIILGDFNGDGKTDFMIPSGYASNRWYKYTSTGTNFSKLIIDSRITYLQNTSTQTHNYFMSDYDKDGKSNLIRTLTTRNSANTLGNILVKCYKNVNGLFYPDQAIEDTSPYQTDIYLNSLPIYLPTGKGIQSKDKPYNPTLEIAFLSNDKIFYFNSNKDNVQDQLLRSVTTGNGVKESITYRPLNSDYDQNYNQIYNSSYSETYPNSNIESASSMQVVSMLEKQSATDYKKQLYSYYGAVSNTEGLGFLGFKSTANTNWFDGNNPIISTVFKFDTSLRGANIESYTVLGQYNASDYAAPSNFISKTTSTYTSSLAANKVFNIKLTNSQQNNGLDNTSSENTVVYDAYNNPTQSTTLVKEGATTQQTTITNLTYATPTSSPYVVGRPTNKTQSVTASGDTMTSEEQYTYNSGGLLTQVKKKGNNTNFITEDNVYDYFGNITKKTISAPALTARETNYEYDTSGRFLNKSIDIEGLATTYSYNTANGLLNSETNPYGLTTSYEYDSWLKKTKTTDYLGKSNTYSYTRNTEKTQITVTGDDGSYSEETFDDLGRKITSGIKNITGAISNISYLYDIYDRNYKVSEPYIGSGASQWNETQYDVYGRPTQNIAFTGKTTSISYSGLTTTINDGTKTKTATKTAIGNTVTMTDTPGGTINYIYFATGNLKSSNYDSVITTIEQDGWGRKTKLTDPSAGEYNYTYNDLGEALTETTPNGTTTYTLNAVGKLTQKTIVGTNTNSTTTYIYDGTTKLLLSSTFVDAQENNATTTTVYTYDSNKRLESSVETTPYASFTKQLTYDAFGRVDTETSIASAAGKSSSKTVQHTYKNGQPWQIIDTSNSQVLWQTNTVNERGQLTSATMANDNIAVSNTYDSYGFITQNKQDRLIVSPGNIITLNTVFDPQKGNLTSRTNSLFSWSESFTYDSLDRLTSFKNTAGVTETQSYDDRGRITQNAVGTYNYTNTSKAYQNTSVTLSPEAAGYYANREGIFSDSMEDKKGWAIYDPTIFTYDTTEKHSGNASLKIANTATTEKTIHSEVWTKIDNTVPTNYTYSAWVKSDAPQAELFLFMKTETETSYYTFVDSKVTNVTNQWTRIEGTFTVPANIKKLNLRLDNNGLGNVWFDDVIIQKTTTTPLVNLQTPNASYTDRQLNISYNTFKSPVEISEAGVDKLSFTYNDNNERSTMFYGSLDVDKNLRPNRKYYSADGSMEIKHNIITGELDFVTYIGGDGYTAPIVLKSNGTTQNYLYLQRDYQGSIVAITNDVGQVLEKRLFDAWGNVLVQDGSGNVLNGLTILDRGYTGHEHLQSVGLINMNGRIYDPKLHRFLQPDNYVQDPSDTQNYNRYGYCWNNPLKYTDPSGEIIPLIIAAIILVSAAVNVYQNWGDITGGTGNFSDIKWGKFLAYGASGAVSGALTVYGGPLGVVWASGAQNLLNSTIKGNNITQIITDFGIGIASGIVSYGVGKGFDALLPRGLTGVDNITNAILTQGTKEVVSNFAGNFTGNIFAGNNIGEAAKNAANPALLATSFASGAFNGLMTFKSPSVNVPQSRSPIVEALQLQAMPYVMFPSPIITPNITIAPPKFQFVPKINSPKSWGVKLKL
jgi:RHS repeat-associated protein